MLWLVLAAGLAASPKVEAQALARRSIIEYNAGDFDRSLADAQKAYELDPLPGLLFNLGQCHRALHNWERAEFFYRGYLRELPTAKNRAAVEGFIAEMEKKQAEAPRDFRPGQNIVVLPAAAPAPAPAAASPAPPPPAVPAPIAAVSAPAPKRKLHGAGVGLLSGGLAALGVGGGAWAVTAVLRTPPKGSSLPAYASTQPSNATAVAGDVLVPLGLVLAAVGLSFLLSGQ